MTHTILATLSLITLASVLWLIGWMLTDNADRIASALWKDTHARAKALVKHTVNP